MMATYSSYLQWIAGRPWLGIGAAAVFVAVVLGRDRLAEWRHRRLAKEARLVTVAAPPEVSPESAAMLWTTMTGVLTPSVWRRLLYGTPHVAWEYTWTGRALAIGIWVPGIVPPGAVEAAVRAAWPAATITVTAAEAPIPAGVADTVGGAHWPQQHDGLPWRTDHDADPLRALFAAGAQVGNRERACVQILARPAPPGRLRAARKRAANVDSAGGRPDVAARFLSSVVRLLADGVTGLLQALLPGPSPRRTPSHLAARVPQDPVSSAAAKSTADKAIRVPHFEIAIRYAVAADPDSRHNGSAGRDRGKKPDPVRAQRIHQRLTGLAHTFAAASAVYTGPNRLRRMKMPAPLATLAGRKLRHGFLATVPELAVLAGLPLDLAVPGLDRARAKAVPAPVAVPAGGRGVKVLGKAQLGGHSVGVNVADARQHMHVIGKTGSGKSTLLLNLILADIKARRGVVLIDPRGDLVNDILDRLPATYANRIVLIDPAQERPACFNPLDDVDDPQLAVDNLVGIFSKIFQGQWGARMDDTMRVACLTLMRHAKPVLGMIPPLLQDPQWRARFTEGLKDPDGLGGYWTWYDSIGETFRGQVIAPVLARLRAFLLRDFVKAVIGRPRSSFDMGDILDGKALLCRLPKGILGEETTRILGSLIVARTWQAAVARAKTPEDLRKDAFLYIDECQNFLTLPGSVADMLAEARGFRLGLVLAHQDLAQLPKETAAAVSANARTKLVFNVDPADARELSRHTKPEIEEHDLSHLDAYTAVARVLVSNRELPAFTFLTNPPPPIVGESTAIRQASAGAGTGGDDEDDDPPMMRVAKEAMRKRLSKDHG